MKQWKWPHSLQHKIILGIVLVGLLPVLLSLVLAYLEERRALRETSGSNFKGIAVEAARKIETQITRGINEAQQLATIPFLRGAVTDANRSYEGREPEKIKAFIEEWEQRWRDRKHPDEFPIFINRIATNYLLDWHAVRKVDYLAILVTDNQGALVLSSFPQVKFFHGDRQWWRAAFHERQGQIYVSDLSFDPTFGTHVLTVAVPIFNERRDQAVGAIGILLRRDSLFRSISEVTAGVTGHAMLMDSDGNALICPVLSLEQHIIRSDLVKAFQASQAGWVQAAQDTHGAKNSIVGFSRLRFGENLAPESFGGRPWVTFVRQDPEETYAPLNELLVKVAAYGVIVFAILWLAGILVARRIVSPIQSLHDGVQRIGSGNLDYHLALPTGDEIEGLANAFNKMAGNLKRSFAQLKDQTREIQETKQYLESLLENANDVIFTLDLDQQFTYVNSKVEIWGYRKEDLIGRPYLTLLSKRRRGRRLKDILDIGAQQEYEVEFMSRTGEARSVMVSVSPLQNDQGAVIGVLGIARDITDRKNMEQQIRNAERLASVGKLAAGVAHEINNPLGGILNCLYNIRKGTLSPARQEEYLMYMEDGLRRAQKIVRQLLDFSQQRDPEFSLSDLNAIVDRVLVLTNHSIAEKNLTLRKQFGTDLPPLFVDPHMIEQVLMNLILNAIQATQKGGMISLLTTRAGEMCEVEVADTGMGIPPEVQPHIFDPFFTTKRTGEGTGLGLSVSLGIVERHGGQLLVESEEGRGTVFTMRLPIASKRMAVARVS